MSNISSPYEQYQWQRSISHITDKSLILNYVFCLSGEVDLNRLNMALRTLLLTKFHSASCKFVSHEDKLLRFDVFVSNNVLTETFDCKLRDFERVVQPEAGDLYCFRYFLDSDGRTFIKLSFSHCIFDGNSYLKFIRELELIWEGLNDDKALTSSAESLYIPEIAVDQRDLQFWSEYLEGKPLAHQFENLPEIASGYASAAELTQSVEFSANKDILSAFNEQGVTLFQGLAAVYAASLSVFDGKSGNDVCIAHTVNLQQEGMPDTCWANLVPLFVSTNIKSNWINLFEKVKEQRALIRQHQHVPTQTVLSNASVSNTNSQAFNVILNESAGLLTNQVPNLDGIDIKLVEKPCTETIADLALTYHLEDELLILRWNSNGKRFNHYLLAKFAQCFNLLLKQAATHPEQAITHCKDAGSLVPVCYSAPGNVGEQQSMASLFIKSFTNNSSKIACIDKDKQYTYADIQKLVGNLQDEFGNEVHTIGVYLSRSALIPVAYLACVLSGKTFVPLDPGLPEQRLLSIAKTANIQVLLTDQNTCTANWCAAHNFQKKMTLTSTLSKVPDFAENRSLRAVEGESESCAYVMFTSGSTGRPKGVRLSRKNLANFLHSMRSFPGLRAEDIVAAVTPISFDISILELLLPFMQGATLVIADDSHRRDAGQLSQWINTHRISYMQATPSTWRMLQAVDWFAGQPMTILTGGEALPAETAEFLLRQPARIFNMYGPTEATIWSGCTEIAKGQQVTLGPPVFGTEYYIAVPDNDSNEHLDSRYVSVAPGQIGELIIAGDCVGLGYANAPQNRAFFELPNGKCGYATGDVVREIAPGQIIFLRRNDKQVKLNGYRIELEEISKTVSRLLSDATVFTVLHTNPVESLISFVWQPQFKVGDLDGIDDAVAQHLPHYMVPSNILLLQDIPLSSSGKADVKKLANTRLDELPLVVEADSKLGFSATHSTPEDSNSEFFSRVQQAIHEAIELRIDDFQRPLGWYGLNSISYNLLSAYFKKHWAVSIASFEFYRFNTLEDLAGTIALRSSESIEVKQNAFTKQPIDKAVNNRNDKSQRIAIIGMDAALPNGYQSESSSLEAFWEGLIHQKDAVTLQSNDSVLGDRGLYNSDQKPQPAAFLPDITHFDARFFSLSPLEANYMDPRQRLLMQIAWRCIEDAGYSAEHLAGTSTSCYVSATGADYALQQARHQIPQSPYALPGHSLSIIANRISAFFDFKGPSVVVDTACSGALVAIVKAVRDLQGHYADYAIAGGASVISDQQIGEGLNSGNFMSPDARCATFDARANGYVRGEGAGLFLLKRLEDAQRDNDRILGVIESVAENHGGRSNSLTAPNPLAQQQLLESCYTPELLNRVSYIETHGTGTQLGDPIEVSALVQAWKKRSPNVETPVWLGAVKSNVGHLEPAAGVASLAKVLLALKHEMLPANLHFKQINEQIQLEGTPFKILTNSTVWSSDDFPRAAGISSFGFGGSNAHIVVGEAPSEVIDESSKLPGPWLIPVSAKSNESFGAICKQLAGFLKKSLLNQYPHITLANIAFTLSTGRVQFDYRTCLEVSSIEDLINQLEVASSVHCPRYAVDPNNRLEVIQATPDTRLSNLSEEFLAGRMINWFPFFNNKPVRRCALPTYVFAMDSHWFKAP